MSQARLRVLVTGAEEHQGLAVIRGLGQAGAYVVAAGSRRCSLGFASRYAADCHRYRAPETDPQGFVSDLVQIVDQTRPDVVVPVVQSTMVALDQARQRIEDRTILALPPSAVVSFAVDKLKTVWLAEKMGIPVPRTVHADTAMSLLCQAAQLHFPVVVKPRGNPCYRATAHRLPFNARYARNFVELRDIVTPFARDASAMLVQEYAPGTGRCVATVCDDGEPLAMLAYDREREWPHAGGVSVMRRSVALEHVLYTYTTTLLRAIGWRGVAMVEFKYAPAAQAYTLMEINARFEAALSVDAGLNLPYLVASLFAGRYQGQPQLYAVGVEERWLRGDLLALLETLEPRPHAFRNGSPTRRQAVRDFIADFRPGVRYDEFQLGDWRPGVVEAAEIAGAVGGWVARSAGALATTLVTGLASWVERQARPSVGRRLWSPLIGRSISSAPLVQRAARLQSAQNLPTH